MVQYGSGLAEDASPIFRQWWIQAMKGGATPPTFGVDSERAETTAAEIAPRPREKGE
jgi:hypothetical protein